MNDAIRQAIIRRITGKHDYVHPNEIGSIYPEVWVSDTGCVIVEWFDMGFDLQKTPFLLADPHCFEKAKALWKKVKRE